MRDPHPGPLLLLLLALPLAAQEQDDLAGDLAAALEEVELAPMPDGFGDDPMAKVAWLAFERHRFVRAREASERMLEENPNSIPGHCLLGLVHHRAEGNLPVALYHIRRCRQLFEGRYSELPGDQAPWFWHVLSITESAFVSGEMGRHEDKIRYLRERDDIYQPERPADRGWPLMRLRRYDEARFAVEQALTLGDPDQVRAAKTVLCAIEAEQQLREESYLACLDAAEYDRHENLDYANPVPFTNAAEAALGMLRMDQAEEFILDATRRFTAPTVSNPWMDLTLLYLAEGRMPEALEAVRKMFRWRSRQPAYIDEQNRAETEMTSAIFLIAAGHPEDAARITDRALDRPDRTGFTSSESEQMEAAVALVDRLANRTAAELLAEEASWSKLGDSIRARLASVQRRSRAWSSGRRAAALLAHQRILDATVRPYLAGSVEIPEWIEPEIIEIVGPGVLQAALLQARERETLAAAEGYFLAYESEIAFLRGRHQETLRIADEALRTLPEAEVLLRARVAAIAARASQARGDHSRALAMYDLAMQSDPGIIRRLGIALPTRFQTSPGPVAKLAARYLRRSPRFDEKSSGFSLRIAGVDDGEAYLLGANDAVLAQVRVTPRAGEDSEDLARRLARELHEAAFAPRLDLTQADIRSLDGSPTAGGTRSRERLRSVLSDLVDDNPSP
ncbi:MAG: hypothetical protein V3T72_22595 [Thermoanaerobaculia bacterium]